VTAATGNCADEKAKIIADSLGLILSILYATNMHPEQLWSAAIEASQHIASLIPTDTKNIISEAAATGINTNRHKTNGATIANDSCVQRHQSHLTAVTALFELHDRAYPIIPLPTAVNSVANLVCKLRLEAAAATELGANLQNAPNTIRQLKTGYGELFHRCHALRRSWYKSKAIAVPTPEQC